MPIEGGCSISIRDISIIQGMNDQELRTFVSGPLSNAIFDQFKQITATQLKPFDPALEQRGIGITISVGG